MAIFKQRPKVRRIKAFATGDGEGQKVARFGANLDDILRAIIWDLRIERKWKTWEIAAAELGIPNSTLNLFMQEPEKEEDEGNGTRISTLSLICASLQIDPVDLLCRHERYREKARFAADSVYDRFRAAIPEPGDAARLILVVEALKARGALRSTIANLEQLVGHGEAQEVEITHSHRRRKKKD